MEAFDSVKYSHSGLNQFRQCKHAYRLIYFVKSEASKPKDVFKDLPIDSSCAIKILSKEKNSFHYSGIYVIPGTHSEMPEGGNCFLDADNAAMKKVIKSFSNKIAIPPVKVETGKDETFWIQEAEAWKHYYWSRAIWYLSRDKSGNYKIIKEKEPIALPFGSSFHEALEWYGIRVKRIQNSEKLPWPSKDDLIDKFNLYWKKRLEMSEIFGEYIESSAGKSQLYYSAAGEQWIKDYYNLINDKYASGQLKVKYIEKNLEFKLGPEEYTITGKIDLIEKFGDKLLMVDHKTQRNDGPNIFTDIFGKLATIQFVFYKQMMEKEYKKNKIDYYWYMSKWYKRVKSRFWRWNPFSDNYQKRILEEAYLLIREEIEPRRKLLQQLPTDSPEIDKNYLFPKCGDCPTCTENPTISESVVDSM